MKNNYKSVVRFPVNLDYASLYTTTHKNWHRKSFWRIVKIKKILKACQ
jgi:hypothetical protein